MKKNINELIKNICEKQNYDEMLIGLINIGKDSEINNILEELDADNSIDDKKKREIYEKIFEFVSNINEELKENVKKIFEMGVKETIKELRKIVTAFKTIAYSDNGFKYYNYTNFYNEQEFNSFIENCRNLEFYNTDVNLKYGDKLITLSTCEYSQKNGRMVIIAKKI